ncbi:hypothetical protein PI126_g6060 [Phytophthora idaei]|nr:hypothetical protein PI126_g6060 [Phytophthora idaei]
MSCMDKEQAVTVEVTAGNISDTDREDRVTEVLETNTSVVSVCGVERHVEADAIEGVEEDMIVQEEEIVRGRYDEIIGAR